MADISRYLQDILSAVYGEEVRGSIHDAIEIINDVSEVVLTTGTAISGPTSSSEGFFDGSLYLNILTMELWKCVGTNSWQSLGILKGSDGSGITSVIKTGTSGLVDTYTITFDDGHTETFDITNGADGADGKNGSIWYKGTALSGTGTSITGFPGNKNDFYLNSTDGYVYTCVKAGGAMLPDAAEWDYVMTLTGGGGASITVVDNLTSTSSTDALSANQGRVLKGYVDEKIANPSSKLDGQVLTYDETNNVWKAQTPSSGATTFAALSDTDIDNPQADQIVQYKSVGGSLKLQNVNMPQGGHTMTPAPNVSLSEGDIVTAVNAGLTEGGINDDVISAFGVGKWSNTMTKTYIVQGIAGSSTPIGTSGIGTWDTTGVDQTGWVTVPALVGASSNGNIDVNLLFDPSTVSVPIVLGGYIIDDTTGKMCIKFGNEIPDTDTHTAKVGIEVTIKRTETTSVS